MDRLKSLIEEALIKITSFVDSVQDNIHLKGKPKSMLKQHSLA